MRSATRAVMRWWAVWGVAGSRAMGLRVLRALGVVASVGFGSSLAAQEGALVVRPGPPALENFESDSDGDGVPDGWYNLRDAVLEGMGGADGPKCLTFTNDRPGRPARASRAFGIDGRVHEALVLGVWVRSKGVLGGERVGEDAGLSLIFLDEGLNTVGRGALGPWLSRVIGDDEWLYVCKRINVPATCRDVILSVGLMGATGVLSIDGMRIDLVARGGVGTTNLVLNGDAEIGVRDADFWHLNEGARRVSPGRQSGGSIELSHSRAETQIALGGSLAGLSGLSIACQAKGTGLRGSGGGVANLFFLDPAGKELPGTARLFRFSGTFAWQEFRAEARVPTGAVTAVVQVVKQDGAGTLWVDDLVATARSDPERGRWVPYHVATDVQGWHAFVPAVAIEAGSALDASFLLKTRIEPETRVGVREGRLHHDDRRRARLFGVAVLPPLATLEAERADALADELARRGINLVRFDDLDAAYGPGRSLIDDGAENTWTLDAGALGRFEHLVAALKKRGVFISISLNGLRRLRAGDQVPGWQTLPPGGGAAAGFDQGVGDAIARFAESLLSHVNPETGMALKDDPMLAWVAISGERSLFDLADSPGSLVGEPHKELERQAREGSPISGRPMWQRLESRQWRRLADRLRAIGLKAPIAGCSHWRREAEFVAAQSAEGLDLIDDRLYLAPATFAIRERRGGVWESANGLLRVAKGKRRADRPYVVSQWCEHTDGVWALEHEGSGLLIGASQAAHEDWDALVRRGVFAHPRAWGAGAPGAQGGDDVFPMVEALNANPAVFALLPHAASLFYRGGGAENPRGLIWDPATGHAVFETPFTQALVVNLDRRAANFPHLTLECATRGGVVAVTSMSDAPIASTKRLLVTIVGRVEPTGMTYADTAKTRPGMMERGPLLCEPVIAQVTWKRGNANIKAYRLASSGKRESEVPLQRTSEGVVLVVDGSQAGQLWELVAE